MLPTVVAAQRVASLVVDSLLHAGDIGHGQIVSDLSQVIMVAHQRWALHTVQYNFMAFKRPPLRHAAT